MTDSLLPLFHALATASTEKLLRFRLMDGVSEYFRVQRWGIYLMNDRNRLADFDVIGVSDAFVERYERFGRSIDPVLRYVLDYHAPAHEALVLPTGAWKQSPLYQHCCAESNHEHIMTGPIVGQGQLIGTVHFARVGDTPAFNAQELASLGAVCSHFSSCLAALRQPVGSLASGCPLTPRERQIADLVAQGLTNAQIGAELWITQNSVKQALKRMFRKLAVSSRTEMVAKIQVDRRLSAP